MAYAAKTKGDEDKISSALAKMMDEDLTLRRRQRYRETDQTLLYRHRRAAARSRCQQAAGRDRHCAQQTEICIPRDTSQESRSNRANIRKQSGGHGQYGDVKMSFEPSGDLEDTICIRREGYLAVPFQRTTSGS